MNKILIASPARDSLEDFASGLNKNSDAEITWVRGLEQVLSEIKKNKFDLLVTDEILPDTDGIECIKKVVPENPFLNTAAISSLSGKDFHEKSEGYGVLMQIPGNPVSEDGEKLSDYLKDILQRTER